MNTTACQLIEQYPTPAEYNALRQAVGWRVYEEAVIAEWLSKSLFGVCANVDGRLVGMARVIGDGGLVFYIQDVIVIPEYQRKGIGKQLMDAVMAYINAHAHHNSIVGLMAAIGKEPFYEAYGFNRRPTETLGAGMTQVWKRQP